MRYGHLLAGLLFLIFFAVLGLLLLSGEAGKKIDVGGKASLSASQTPAPSGYYNEPQTMSTAEILYTDAGFSPSAVSAPRGAAITFVNRSSSYFWPASNPHPAHTGYPDKGSCGGSSFDACSPIPPGQTWTFRFDRPGTWGYHDHLNPSHVGAITIQ